MTSSATVVTGSMFPQFDVKTQGVDFMGYQRFIFHNAFNPRYDYDELLALMQRVITGSMSAQDWDCMIHLGFASPSSKPKPKSGPTTRARVRSGEATL